MKVSNQYIIHQVQTKGSFSYYENLDHLPKVNLYFLLYSLAKELELYVEYDKDFKRLYFCCLHEKDLPLFLKSLKQCILAENEIHYPDGKIEKQGWNKF